MNKSIFLTYSKYSLKPFTWSLILFCAVTFTLTVRHAQAVTCHCFKERSFKPSQPASADPYILATARNSLVAAAAGIDKGAVVRQRMTGTTETDLWLSGYLSTLVDKSAEDLLEARDRATSWPAAFEVINLESGKLGPAFQKAQESGDADGMARSLADPVLARAFNTGEPTLARMRESGANIAESALGLYLAGQMNRTPESILSEVRSGGKTWGALFNSMGIQIDTVGDRIAEAVRKTVNGEQ